MNVRFIIYWLMSPEIPRNPEVDSHYEATVEFCSRINQALEKAFLLRQDPYNEELAAELYALERGLVKDGFHGEFHFRLIVPEGADARATHGYINRVAIPPDGFPADRVNRIDVIQADFYDHRDDNEPVVHLTSFDYNLRAEPIG